MQEKRHITTYRQSLRDRILNTAMALFSTRGVKAVKMDDIAASLGISKRTLYEIYENKEVLLFEGVRSHRENTAAQMRAFAEEADNVMDIVLFIYQLKNREFRDTSPLFFEDLQKYPRIEQYMEQERKQNQDEFMEFMQRGVSEGYFRADVNYQLISHLFDALGEYMREHRLYQEYSSEELFNNLLFVTLRGFCTQRGVEVLDQFMKESGTEKRH